MSVPVTQIRERPPLRLSINVETPSGVLERWGTDDPDPTKAPQGLHFSTVMPGGYETLTFALDRDPRHQYADLQRLANLVVRGVGGIVAGEFRLEDLPDTGGFQEQISPQSPGWQAHLDDDDTAAMVYVDQNQQAWQSPSIKRQLALVTANLIAGSSSIIPDPADHDPAIALQMDTAWSTPNKPDAELWYDSAGAGLIGRVYYDVQAPSSDPNWHETVALAADDAGATSESSGNVNSPAGARNTGYFSPAVPYRYAIILHTYASSSGGALGSSSIAYWRPTVYGDHGIAGVGPDPQGLLASDVVAHAVGRWCPKLTFTTGPDGTIQPSSFVIPQLVFTPTTVSQMIKQAVQYELLDWAVWEGRTFWLNPRGQSARKKMWRARIGPAQLQETGPQTSRLWNGVVVMWQNVDGTAGVVGPPGTNVPLTDASLLDTDPENPCNLAGINRYAPLQMLGVSTLAAAVKTGQIFLQEQKLLDTSGQAMLQGHVEDSAGVIWPAWMVKAGDYISFVDCSNPGYRRIVHTDWDHDTRTNTIQLDQPPDGLTALLERLSVSLTPLGLS